MCDMYVLYDILGFSVLLAVYMYVSVSVSLYDCIVCIAACLDVWVDSIVCMVALYVLHVLYVLSGFSVCFSVSLVVCLSRCMYVCISICLY